MNSLQTLTEQASEIATSANGVTSPTQLATYATQVGSLIQQALQAANSKDAQGNYIFGGTITDKPPFVATTDASGNVTGVTYQGNTSTPQSEIGPNLTVSAQTPGANSSGTGSAGLLSDSRSGADLFSHLISLQQDLTSGDTAAIASTDSANLTKDENNIVSGIAANGVAQSTLESASTRGHATEHQPDDPDLQSHQRRPGHHADPTGPDADRLSSRHANRRDDHEPFDSGFHPVTLLRSQN